MVGDDGPMSASPSESLPARLGARLTDLDWPARTERLSIRPAVAADTEATWTYRRDPETSRWLSSAPADPTTYRTHFTDADRLAVTLIVERDTTVIGDLMLGIEDAWAQPEVQDRARGVHAKLGWCLSPDHTGRGFATEAVTELLRICFVDLGLRRVAADCFEVNTASWRLMERVGMRCETRSVRDGLHRDGTWYDGRSYALLAQEWFAARP